jgi:hypothetical protein
MAENLVDLLVRRDELSREEVLSNLKDSWRDWSCGEDPDAMEDMLLEDFGVEPDYIDDLLILAEANGW